MGNFNKLLDTSYNMYEYAVGTTRLPLPSDTLLTPFWCPYSSF